MSTDKGGMIPDPQRDRNIKAQALIDARNLCESEAHRWQHQSPRTSEHWASAARQLEELRIAMTLDDAVHATAPLRNQELDAENIPSGFMETRFRAEAGEAVSVRSPQPCGWYCACGWPNGINLANCAQCTRSPGGENPVTIIYESSRESSVRSPEPDKK